MDDTTLTIKHWMSQLTPPIVLLIPFFSGDGNVLWFWVAIGFFVALVSIISIIFKLFRFSRKKYFLVRPAISLILVAACFLTALYTFNNASSQAEAFARELQAKCLSDNRCPTLDTDKANTYSILAFGDWYPYPARYELESEMVDGNKQETFLLYMHLMTDTGKEFIGGNHMQDIIIKNHTGD